MPLAQRNMAVTSVRMAETTQATTAPIDPASRERASLKSASTKDAWISNGSDRLDNGGSVAPKTSIRFAVRQDAFW